MWRKEERGRGNEWMWRRVGMKVWRRVGDEGCEGEKEEGGGDGYGEGERTEGCEGRGTQLVFTLFTCLPLRRYYLMREGRGLEFVSLHKEHHEYTTRPIHVSNLHSWEA